ncbi:MAG: hypothetical protein BV457_01170 [Thermoplasmata archaeon M9B1D]|nr:MAG: hypothetical protein BV457_01170 [Thermoplasmata archaeon M9B1D]
MAKKKKICFVGSLSHTFVKRDLEILIKHFDVDVIEPPSTIFEWLRYPSKVRKKVKSSDIVFGWFAGWHSIFGVYFSKIYKKKSLVVVGGYDIEYMPEIDYGALTNLKEKIAAKYVLKNSDLLLPFSDYAVNNLKKMNIKTDFNKIYIGCNSKKYFIKGKKEDIVLTVGGVKKNNLKRKGLEFFVRIAKYFPKIRFVLAGKIKDDSIDYLKSIASDNVEFTDFIDDTSLIDLYQKSKVYCQLSYQEGFGLSLAEAMLCGAIPVVNRRGSIQEVVGDTGFYINKFEDEKETINAIKKALNSNIEIGIKARHWIEDNYSLEKREYKLIEIINKII